MELQGWFPSTYIEKILNEERCSHLLGIILKDGEKAREEACLAAWKLVDEVGQAGVDWMKSVLAGQDEEAVIAVLKALNTLVENSEGTQRSYVERFGVGQIARLLRHGSARVQFVACEAVAALCSECESNRDAFVEGGVAQPLVAVLGNDDAEVQEGALFAIVVVINEDNNSMRKDEFCKAGAAVAICQLLQSNEAFQEHAMNAIGLFCHTHLQSQDAFREAGCVPLLVGLLLSSSADVQQCSSEVILKLSEGHGENTAALCEWGAVPMLLDVVVQGSGEVQKQACMAAWNLVLGGGGGQAGVDGMKSVLAGLDEEAVIVVLEVLSIIMKCSKKNQLAFFEYFGARQLSGLFNGSAVVQSKVSELIRTMTLDNTLNRGSHPPNPPSINLATQWLDEDGRVCPKNVDHATQCPKGHPLEPLDSGGAPQVQQASGADLMCRVCHASTPRQRAREWLVCSVAGCCGGYAVCAACVVLLGCSQKAAAASTDDFCMMVLNKISPPISLLLECVRFELTFVRVYHWSTCGGSNLSFWRCGSVA